MKRFLPLVVVFLSVMLIAADAPRKPHPFAPSLPDLTQKQEEAFDKIIDDFILYDVGALKGEEGKKALEEFRKLPPESIFALIRGLNRAAAIDDSCPAVVIGRKITSILRSSTDAQLLEFARENVGAGVKQSRHLGVIKDLRVGSMLRKREVDRMLALNPKLVAKTTGKEPREMLLIKPIASLDQTAIGKLRAMSIKELATEAELNRGSKLRPILMEMEKRQGDAVLGTLAQSAVSYEPEIKELAGNLLVSYLARQDEAFLKKQLVDDQKQVRLAAVKAVSKKNLRLGSELIERLKDDDVDVRLAAKAALVKLAKGMDYGPAPDAPKAERDEALEQWRAWWTKQAK
jgi:hypothetical protein